MKYKYNWYNRNVAVIFILLYFFAGMFFSLWRIPIDQMFNFEGRRMEGLIGIWSIIVFLILTSYFLGRRIYIFLNNIEMTVDGIKGGLRLSTFEWWPKNNVSFIAWIDIERLEFFSYPDNDAMKMKKWSGFRVIAGNRKIVVYDQIKNYAELREEIKSHISADKIDNQVKAVFYDKHGKPKT